MVESFLHRLWGLYRSTCSVLQQLYLMASLVFLVELARLTDVAKKRGYEDWLKVSDGMDWKEAQAWCKGVTFDGAGEITKIELSGLGISGKDKACTESWRPFIVCTKRTANSQQTRDVKHD